MTLPLARWPGEVASRGRRYGGGSSGAGGKAEPGGYRLVHNEVKSFNDAVLRGIVRLHGHGPLVVFPAGGVHGYWHNRADGKWEDWVMDEVLPRVVHRYWVDP